MQRKIKLEWPLLLVLLHIIIIIIKFNVISFVSFRKLVSLWTRGQTDRQTDTDSGPIALTGH